MGHVQRDNGSVVIGTRGKWLVADPGYQQYMRTREREFTLGRQAHNAPVINGHEQSAKPLDRRIDLRDLGNGLARARIDITGSYPKELGLSEASRTVWLLENRLVVVADTVRGEGVKDLQYSWHGHPEAAWWVQDNWARIHFPDVTLWLSCPQALLSDADVTRLRGSRGHLTLTARVGPLPAVWWVFGLGDRAPAGVTVEGATGLIAEGTRFEVDAGKRD
jgi:hypothetical protein